MLVSLWYIMEGVEGRCTVDSGRENILVAIFVFCRMEDGRCQKEDDVDIRLELVKFRGGA